MPQCKHFEICGLDANPGEDLCILHSHDLNKDKSAFDKALEVHRKKNGHDFRHVVFPGDIVFGDATFNKRPDFSVTKFKGRADFSGATFVEGADFGGSTFSEEADFSHTTFINIAGFLEATFAKPASFKLARFNKWASFAGATFSEGADFSDAKFVEGAYFMRASFLGSTLFVSQDHASPIFFRAQIDFVQAIIAPLDALIFRNADLRQCSFLYTDLRKAEFVGVGWPEITGKRWPEIVRKMWPRIGNRFGVYDEVEAERKGETSSMPLIEQLYRQLKQNHEDRRDYERAGDFHYGEKEMRRKNPETHRGLRFFLSLYKCVSGYGEQYWPPLSWAVVLLVICTVGYVLLGLAPAKGTGFALHWKSGWDWLKAAFYSFQVMTLLKPADLVPIGYAKLVHASESLLGPILLGLFALALRQRLKR